MDASTDPQLGILSFCDRPSFNAKNDAFKAAAVDQLRAFGAHILRKHHDVLDMGRPLQGDHLACLRSHGNPYFVLLSRGVIMFIDRKIQPGYTLPRIIVGHGRFDATLFDNGGTLMEGEMVKSRSGTWAFLANDLLALEGRSIASTPLPARLEALANVLDERRTADAALDACIYQVKRHEPFTAEGLAALGQLKDEQDFPTRGLFVRPMTGRTRFLDFEADKVRPVLRPAKDVTEFREAPPAPTSLPAVPATATAGGPSQLPSRMFLRRTNFPDVYDVHAQLGPAGPVGVAHVPTLALSEALRVAFRDVPTGGVLPCECTFRDAFGKWEPRLPL